MSLNAVDEEEDEGINAAALHCPPSPSGRGDPCLVSRPLVSCQTGAVILKHKLIRTHDRFGH